MGQTKVNGDSASSSGKSVPQRSVRQYQNQSNVLTNYTDQQNQVINSNILLLYKNDAHILLLFKNDAQSVLHSS